MRILILSLVLLISCSHKPLQKHHHVVKSWHQILKPKKPHHDKRSPASAVPGINELVATLKNNPSFFSVPVGMEITKTYKTSETPFTEKYVYLKQNHYGYFQLDFSNLQNGVTEPQLQAHNIYNLGDIEYSLLNMPGLNSIKKMNAQEFVMNFESGYTDEDSGEEVKYICDMKIDVKKSMELAHIVCKNSAGQILSESTVTSIKAISLSSYRKSLENTALVVYPNVLLDDYEFDSVHDEDKKDWSFLIP